MFKPNGFTLLELLITLAILAIILSIAVPGFSELIERNRLQAATHELRNALGHTREMAVLRQRPISIVATDRDWAKGWSIFVDDNNNGIQDAGETVLLVHPSLTGIRVQTDATSRRYIHYTPRGNSIQPSGAFHAGHLSLCGNTQSGYRIVINKAGRIREESGPTASLCAN